MKFGAIENTITNKQASAEKNYSLEVLKRFSAKIEDRHIDSILECLERTLQKAEKLGEGKNAEVFKLEAPWEEICVKVFKENREIINEFDQEFEFQQEVKNIGINTPGNLLAIENKTSGQEYLLMERVNGYSLKDLSEGKNEKARKELIKIAKDFFSQLERDVEKMNKGNIYHRDLHHGNVMFDVISKKPVIIDFGHATRAFSSDDDKDIFVGWGFIVNPRTGKRIEARQTFLKDSMEVKKMRYTYE